jgi:AraC-like DNA-binding protein
MDDVRRVESIEADSARVSPRHVKRALAYMRANLPERITLSSLTSGGVVSERTLLRQFRRFVGLAPLDYLRRLRLNTARIELADPQNDSAIADIAARCGFSHLGRFASEYRRLFEEAPSDTRLRVRERTATSVTVAAMVWSSAPTLMLFPLRTETLQESIEARDVTERLAAALSRMRIASVALADPRHLPARSGRQPRNIGTEYCLHGRLTRHNERARVIVRLVDLASGRHLWGDSFDGLGNDPFELQDRVVDAVLCNVAAHITDAELARTHAKDPKDLAVRDLILRAMPRVLCSDAKHLHKAIEDLNRAVEMDPADPAAVAWLAFSQYLLVPNYATEAPASATEAAVRLSRRALSLNGNDPIVLVACGAIAHWLRRFDEADALLTRALAIDPTSAWAWERQAYSFRPCIMSRAKDGDRQISAEQTADRAIARFQRALQLRGPGMSRSNCWSGIASAHFIASRWEKANSWTRRAMAENPEDTSLYRSVFTFAFKMRDRGTMVRSVELLLRAHPHVTVSYHANNFAAADPLWLEALRSAGMPLC